MPCGIVDRLVDGAKALVLRIEKSTKKQKRWSEIKKKWADKPLPPSPAHIPAHPCAHS